MDGAMFSGSNLQLNDCRLTVHNQHMYSNPVRSWQNGWNTLYQNVAQSAIHNSAERYDAPKCHEGTRVAVINRIIDWVRDFTIIQVFLWMYGPAGAGKSAIAGSVADKCRAMGIWTVSFFSRHAAERNSDKHLAATLAYQFCTLIPEMREIVGETIENNPAIFTQNLSDQLKALITDPIKNVLHIQHVRKIKKRILDALSASESQFKIPAVFLIASRPELEIRPCFASNPLQTLTIGLPLDDEYQADEDIYKFLKDKFDDIKATHILQQHLDPSWPGEDTLRLLVHKSSGQFIYVSTVIKYIELLRYRPQDRLQVVLGLLATNHNETPFASLDALYFQILSSVDDIARVLEILMHMTLSGNWVHDSPDTMETQLVYDEGDVHLILCDMHALLRIPAGQEDDIEFYHASFGDFLSDKSRSGVFFIDPIVGHAKLACKLVTFITENKNSDSLDYESILGVLVYHCTSASLSPDISDLGRCLRIDFFSILLKREEWPDAFIYWNDLKDCLRFKKNDPDAETALTAQNLLQYYHGIEDDWFNSILKTLHPHTMSAFAAFIAIPGAESEWHDGDTLMELLEYPEIGERSRDLRSLSKSEFNSFLFCDSGVCDPEVILKSRLLVIKEFLLDQERSGPYFVDDIKRSILCQRIVDWVFKRHAKSDCLLPWRIESEEDAFRIFFSTGTGWVNVLATTLPDAGNSHQLATVLREVALVVPNVEGCLWKDCDDHLSASIHSVLKEAAIAGLEYIKRCNISYLEHTHPDGYYFCAICDDQSRNQLAADNDSNGDDSKEYGSEDV